MKALIAQPCYLPWTNFFRRLKQSDIYVALDNVDFITGKESFINRTKIRTKQGWQWLTIPVKHTGDKKHITETVPIPSTWIQVHQMSIQRNYAKTENYKDIADLLNPKLISKNLSDINLYLIQLLAEKFGITTRIILASDLGIHSTKSDLILDICIDVGADEYLSGPFGKTYLELRKFHEAGIDVEFASVDQEPYPQRWLGWVDGLSAIDYLANVGRVLK